MVGGEGGNGGGDNVVNEGDEDAEGEDDIKEEGRNEETASHAPKDIVPNQDDINLDISPIESTGNQTQFINNPNDDIAGEDGGYSGGYNNEAYVKDVKDDEEEDDALDDSGYAALATAGQDSTSFASGGRNVNVDHRRNVQSN